MNVKPASPRVSGSQAWKLTLLLPLGAGLLGVSAAAATVKAWQPLPKSAPAESVPPKGAMVLASANTADADAPPKATPEPRAVNSVDNATVVTEVVPVPSVPAAETVPAAAPIEPATPIQGQVGGKALYSFRALDVELKTALAMFARANDLNIVPDRDVTGQITLDVRDLPLAKVMQALLESYDYVWEHEDGLIRVRAKETKEFWIDYLRLNRKGVGTSSATLASGMSGGKGGGGGGGGAAQGGSAVNLTANNTVDFWTELREELGKMLTPDGRESLAINMTAGVIQITDRPSALKRVRKYVDSLSNSVARQVEIRARIFDVTLRDQFQFGIDWEHAAQAFGGVATTGGSTIVASPVGGAMVRDSALSFLFENSDTSVILKALQEQGEVNVVSQPRIRVVNNQTAMIKVGTETPFFTSRTTFIPGSSSGTTTSLQEEEVSTITVGTILSITPQISSNEWVTLDIAPVLTSLVETVISPSETTTAPVLDIKQASTLVRCKNGTTIVIGGLMQDEKGTTLRKVPLVGDIPLLGHLFRGRHDYKSKRELVISITPAIVD
ncbi:MAG: secretin N-terminal domain-containing protein [Verrucomicrobiales bacterium]|nr:secretin N-terminal domain-containing protein [Verrucomicrobiales bacterium]